MRDEILSPEAVEFLTDLERRFRDRRRSILSDRARRQQDLDAGELPRFPAETAEIRAGEWRIAPVPDDLMDRRVEITGPVDAKMMINALNSGAKVFMADFEDATTPTWSNLIEGQRNLLEAYRHTLQVEVSGRSYALGDDIATLVVRPRGWHLDEKHLTVDGSPVSASLFDFGLYVYHCSGEASEAGTGPYLYLPKLESRHEARLWNEVLTWTEERLGMDPGSIKATVLIENILAAFEMDEILYELHDHAAGLNAGRWDYIFSMIKKFRNHPRFVLPDRAAVTMTAPFMKAYTDLMIATCHRRGAHAIGGMAAFIPNRRDPEVTRRALEAVAADKRREVEAGCDGTWVAHPDLVPVATAEFDRVLGARPHQIDAGSGRPSVSAEDLLDTTIDAPITENGVRANVSVGIGYLTSWLGGRGAAAIANLMEDVATAEISRSQIWQWVRHRACTVEGRVIDEPYVHGVCEEILTELKAEGTPDEHLTQAKKLFEHVALSEEFVEFSTLPGYGMID